MAHIGSNLRVQPKTPFKSGWLGRNGQGTAGLLYSWDCIGTATRIHFSFLAANQR